MKRLIPSLVLTGALALTGFGCRPPNAQQAAAPSTVSGTPTPSTPTFDPNAPWPKDSEGPSAEGLIARQALRNLAIAKTYRADMEVPTTQGTVKASADVNKDQGILGRLEVPTPQGQLISEVYISGQVILFRQGTTTWSDISKTPDGTSLSNLFQNALAPNGTDVSAIVANSARTVDISDDPQGCKRYTLTQVADDGQRFPYRICIKNDLPVYLTLATGAGNMTISYKDINGAVEVKKPQ